MTELSSTAPLPGVEVRPGSGHYAVFDHGAHVWAWQPDGHPHPVLWVSSASAFSDGKAIRGGIPLCFPWFGPGLSRDKKPAHGFVRTVSWRRGQVRDRAAAGGALEVELAIDPSITGEQPEFPHDYLATLTVRFAPDHLEVALRAENTGQDAFTIEEALHTYLAVSDVRLVSVDGLDGAAYLDKVADDTGFDNVQSGPLAITGPTDRVFVHDGEVTLDDPGYGRRLSLTSSGAANVVVWNPWSDGAAAIADIGEGEWQQFLCIEAANVFDNAITLLPGDHWTITQRIQLD